MGTFKNLILKKVKTDTAFFIELSNYGRGKIMIKTFEHCDINFIKNLGRTIGQCADTTLFIAMTGDLGAGKTTLTKYIAEGLEISDTVTSPTFVIAEEYTGRLKLYHFDAYRVRNEQEMTDIGFDEYLGKQGVIVVEWADMILNLLPPDRIDIQILYENSNERRIIIMANGKTEDTLKQICEKLKGDKNE